MRCNFSGVFDSKRRRLWTFTQFPEPTSPARHNHMCTIHTDIRSVLGWPEGLFVISARIISKCSLIFINTLTLYDLCFFSTCRPGRAVFPRRTGAVAPSASLLGGLGGWSARSCGTAARDPSASRTTSPSASKILPLTKSRQGYGASSELNTWYRNPHPAPFHRSQPTKHTHTFPITHNRNSSSNRNTQISHKFALTDLLCNNNHNNETSILSPHNSHCAQCTYR